MSGFSAGSGFRDEHPANDTNQAAAKDALEEVTSDEPVEPEIREHKGQFKALPE